MTDHRTRAGRDLEHEIEEERRLRRARVTAATGQVPEPDEPVDERAEDEDDDSPAQRMEQQTLWVDLQVRKAMERGEFDNLPGAGKPIKGLGGAHDPNWWVKSLVEREQITGVLPPALQLRKDDALLDDRLDQMSAERQVREELEDFNARVMRARYTPADGPPLVTMPRDVEAEVERWRERRRARHTDREATAGPEPQPQPRGARRWFRRRRD